MADPTKVSYLSRKLGAKLRRMREEAGHTLASAAPRLDRTTSALHRVETGETKADVHLVKSMMDFYDIFVPGLLEETRRAAKPPWYRAYGVKGPATYLAVETEATRIWEFAAQVMPGLLQTEDYIRSIFDMPGSDADRAVTIRAVRQSRLISEENPLELAVVIDEGVLRRIVGSPEVMLEQWRHLLQAACLPSITLQVLPLARPAHRALAGSFSLLGFQDPDDAEYLFIEHLVGTVHTENPKEVKKARLAIDQLRSVALCPADSIALIEGLLEAPPWTKPY